MEVKSDKNFEINKDIDSQGFDVSIQSNGKSPATIDNKIGWIAIDKTTSIATDGDTQFLTDTKTNVVDGSSITFPSPFGESTKTIAHITSQEQAEEVNLRLRSFDSNGFIPHFETISGGSSGSQDVSYFALSGNRLLTGISYDSTKSLNQESVFSEDISGSGDEDSGSITGTLTANDVDGLSGDYLSLTSQASWCHEILYGSCLEISER